MFLHVHDGLWKYEKTAASKKNSGKFFMYKWKRKRWVYPEFETHGRSHSPQHNAGRALTSDLSVNSFMIVFYEKLFSSSLDREFWLNFKKILIGIH